MIREQSIRLPFGYAAGKGGGRFLAALRDECQVVGSRCACCRHVACPAQSYCSKCGEAEVHPVDVGPAGTLVSWTELSQSTAGSRTFGLVLLDGADTAIVHRLIDATAPWTAGSRVRARFGEARTGSILDIVGFAPEGGVAPGKAVAR